MDLRSKARTVSGLVTDPSKLLKLNYDGSSTSQAPSEDSEVTYQPAIFKDSFRMSNNINTLSGLVTDPGKLLKLNYDGSSTSQAPSEDSEVTYQPAIFKDSFRMSNNINVKYDYYIPAGELIPTNKRFVIQQNDTNCPLWWSIGDVPGPQWKLHLFELEEEQD